MTDSQRWFTLLGIIILGCLIYLLSPILIPFVIAMILAYLFNPLVNRLVRLHIPRIFSVIIVFVLLIVVVLALLLLLIPVLQQQLNALIKHIPVINNWIFNVALVWINKQFHLQEVINVDSVKQFILQHLPESGAILANLWSMVTHSTGAVITFFANLFLIPVLTFYFLWDWQRVTEAITRLLPRHSEASIVKMTNECGDVLSSFFRGQLSVMLCLAIIYGVGLWIVGLQVGLLIGVFAGILSIVPYLGFIVGIVLAIIMSLIQFHDWTHVMGVIFVFGVGEFCESWILIPWLIGDRVGIHPLAVIFAVMAFGSLFGFIGVLIAVPLAAVIMVFLRHLHRRYLKSRYYEL